MKAIINNKEVEIKKGMTILDAAKSVGIKIPTLCYLEGLFPAGACRMCVVEVEGFPKLVTSCSTEITEGMKVKTHSPKVITARKTILELILANHPDDCLYCNKNGDCELQSLAHEFNIHERSYHAKKIPQELDSSSPSLVRDPEKCILCGRCVRICEEVQNVSAIDFMNRGAKATIAPAFQEGLGGSTCINCGQCIRVCPTGALTEKNNILEVLEALNDPEKVVMVQHAPAISVTIGEYFGLETEDHTGVLNAALRKSGFDKVFDTSFSADLTIMEEGSELVHRIKNNGVLPMMTSCSPGWIKYVEQFHPELIPNISTCKSPQQMMGALLKSYYSEKTGIDPKKIVSVSIMPCTAKKYEAGRPEMGNNGIPDVDYALTTRELAKLFKMLNIDLKNITPEDADDPLGERSTAGKIFGATGGVMEAAIRSAYYLITGKELENPEVLAVRDLEGVKEASVDIDGLTVNVAVVNGLGNVEKVIENLSKYHFIEVMTCPGGCISGGGQPYGLDKEKIKARMQALYNADSNSTLRLSHKNESVQKLYKEYLGAPLGEKSHKLLHTHYKAK